MTRPPKKIPGVENRLRTRRDGSSYFTYRVRWVDPATSERRGEEFDTQTEAADYKAKLRLAKRGGRMADVDAGRETLADFVAEWWRTYAAVELQPNTLKTYRTVYNRHLLPRVGHLQLRQIEPQTVATLRRELEADGVGAPTVRYALAILQSVMARAVEWGRIRMNPVAAVKKPSAKRKLAIRPLPPMEVEALAAAIKGADQALVLLLAYAGLRPEEALALQWRHIRKDTILVEQKNVDGQIFTGQKTERPPRTVDLLPSLRKDLAAYRLQAGASLDTAYVFPSAEGETWREHDYRNWRRRTFRPAAAQAGLANPGPWNPKTNRYVGPRPYDLRHSYASMRIHEGDLSIAELADQMGHSIQTLLGTYTHVIAELKGQRKVKADTQIRKARTDRLKAAQ